MNAKALSLMFWILALSLIAAFAVLGVIALANPPASAEADPCRPLSKMFETEQQCRAVEALRSEPGLRVVAVCRDGECS